MQENLRHKIENIMYASKGEEAQGALEAVLYGISKIYYGAQVLRREAYRRGVRRTYRLPCKVVSVGNLAVGGTGKTPMTAYLARALQEMGRRVVVISRGYKGRGGRDSHVVSDGHQVLMDAAYSGDEAQLLARQLMPVPVLIGRDRYQAGMDAVSQFQPDVIVLDDGFQHMRLQRDLDIVLLDHAAPQGNGHILPRGILREPVNALASADGIVFTRATDVCLTGQEQGVIIPAGLPVFKSAHKPYHFLHKPDLSANDRIGPTLTVSHDFSRLNGARVAVFSGIARNGDFQQMLENFGAELVSTRSFNDHHPYTRGELDRIAAEALQTSADFLVATEKDFMRLPPDFHWPLDLMVVGVEIDFGGQEENFLEFLHTCLKL